jgi:hypothetical protein
MSVDNHHRLKTISRRRQDEDISMGVDVAVSDYDANSFTGPGRIAKHV